LKILSQFLVTLNSFIVAGGTGIVVGAFWIITGLVVFATIGSALGCGLGLDLAQNIQRSRRKQRPKPATHRVLSCRSAASPDQPFMHRAAFCQTAHQRADFADLGSMLAQTICAG